MFVNDKEKVRKEARFQLGGVNKVGGRQRQGLEDRREDVAQHENQLQ